MQGASGNGPKSNKNSLTSLRSYTKRWILHNMLENARKHAHFSKDYMILVVDRPALKVFSSSCKFFDLYQSGVYHVEKLEVKRKKFPHTDAIYFISPTQSSVEYLLRDFSDEHGKPQYGGVHLCFLSHLEDSLFSRLVSCKALAPHIFSFSEINLDFYLFNDNVFYFAKKELMQAFKIVDEQERGVDNPSVQKVLTELAHKLFTVCAIFMEYPYIQYQKESKIAYDLAQKLDHNLKTFYYNGNERKKFREPRGSLLLLDRSFDLIAPVNHDYFYQSNVYDFRKISDEGETKIDNKSVYLNDADELWVRFRDKHIAEVHGTLNMEVSAIASESKKKTGQSTQDMSLQDMAELLRSMPKYEEMMKSYQIHMEITNKVILGFTKNKLKDLIEIEQDIISGLHESGKKINNAELVKRVSQISKELQDCDYLRLLMVFFACFDLSQKDKHTMLKSIANEQHRLALQNVEFLDQGMVDSQKFQRRKKEMTVDELNEYKKNLSKSDYGILRSEAKVVKLLKAMHNNELSPSEFPFSGEQRPAKKNVAKKKGAQNPSSAEFYKHDSIDSPRLFLFVFGGLSHHEVASISNLQEKLSAQIIPGSNEILAPRDYIKQLETLHKKESLYQFQKVAEQKVGDEEDEEDEEFGDAEGEPLFTIND